MSAFGLSWRDPEVQAAALDSAQCSMFVSSWLLGSWRCEEPSTRKVHAVCVHEHVVEYHTCADHAEPEQFFCNQCADSAEPHECPLVMTVTELAGASSSAAVLTDEQIRAMSRDDREELYRDRTTPRFVVEQIERVIDDERERADYEQTARHSR